MTKYIVKNKQFNDYWAAEGKGTVLEKRDAYQYSVEELKNHYDRKNLELDEVVLIPVEETGA